MSYENALNRFELFVGKGSWKDLTVDELDFKLAWHMEAMFFAAVGWAEPRFARIGVAQLSRSTHALRGMTKLAPVTSRLPLLGPFVFGLAQILLGLGEESMAARVLLGFHMCLRPGELARARWRH